MLLLAVAGGMISRAELPPKVEEAMRQGLLALAKQDWEGASGKLQEVQKFAPAEPGVYRNLGDAESKIPGREMRAFAWYGAYLAVSPGHPPDEMAVVVAMDALRPKFDATVHRVLVATQDAAGRLATGPERVEAFGKVAELWARAGDFPAARQTAVLTADQAQMVETEYIIAEQQVIAKNQAGALQTVRQMGDPKVRGKGEARVARRIIWETNGFEAAKKSPRR